MSQPKKRSNRKHMNRRYALIVAAMLACAAGIVWHVVDNTVVSADAWNEKAHRELSRCDTIAPERGNILAADGSILATNLRYYTVRMDYRSERFMEHRLRQQIDTIADSLARYFPVRDAKGWRAHLLKPIDNIKDKSKRPRAYRLLDNISYADYRRLRTFPFFKIPNRNRNGLSVESKMRRVNPYGDMARRSIGGVGATRKCKEIHGISGLEKALDSMLFGTPGIAKKVALTRGIVN